MYEKTKMTTEVQSTVLEKQRSCGKCPTHYIVREIREKLTLAYIGFLIKHFILFPSFITVVCMPLLQTICTQTSLCAFLSVL